MLSFRTKGADAGPLWRSLAVWECGPECPVMPHSAETDRALALAPACWALAVLKHGMLRDNRGQGRASAQARISIWHSLWVQGPKHVRHALLLSRAHRWSS